MKNIILYLLCNIIVFFFLNSCATMETALITGEHPPAVFSEIWGYLMKGEEKEITGAEAYSHIFYFSAEVNDRGRIDRPVQRPGLALRNGYSPDIHLVITLMYNRPLIYFSLNPEYGVRDKLIDDIRRVSEPFDGVQIDFEGIPPEDAQAFYSFLRELKKRLPGEKMFTIAVPARKKDMTDAYQYGVIAQIVDRMVIMAYDEHWSTSEPGPVASLPWCADIVTYAKSVIPNEKIIMGLPFYGRAWQDRKLSRALRFIHTQELLNDKWIRVRYDKDTGPHFEYREKVTVKVFYDNQKSLLEKLKLYESNGVNNVSFWRVGQGPDDLWLIIKPLTY